QAHSVSTRLPKNQHLIVRVLRAKYSTTVQLWHQICSSGERLETRSSAESRKSVQSPNLADDRGVREMHCGLRPAMEMQLMSAQGVTMGERLADSALEVSCRNYGLTELSLLLPQWQVDALEQVAQMRGLTTGQMLRRLIA